MNELAITTAAFQDLRRQLASSDESAAILLATVVSRGRNAWRLLVNEARYAAGDDYIQRSPFTAVLRPAFVAAITKEARNRRKALIFVHTHPGAKHPTFSHTDDAGEVQLAAFVQRARGPHAALLLGATGCAARVLGMPTEPLRVVEVGSRLSYSTGLKGPTGDETEYARQIRAFGRDGQAVLDMLRVGIVGLGGTGSFIAQQLAHLGVHQFVLLDPDAVELSNLNRLAGATRKDEGLPKVDVAARHIRSIRPDAQIEPMQGSVLLAKTARRLVGADFLFCCTDSFGSRAVINQLAYQYLVPCIDMGVSVTTSAGQVSHITGRVQMLAPGLACLACNNMLDADAVRHDLMTDAERQADPYFLGEGEPQPAVMSINGTVASLAVTMFLGAVAGVPASARYQNYNGVAGTVRAVAATPDPICVVCSSRGAIGRGDEWRLPARQS